jgi:hypothetical protein
MIDRLEASLELTPIAGKRCGKGMFLPSIVLRSRTARSIVDSQADANPRPQRLGHVALCGVSLSRSERCFGRLATLAHGLRR